MRNADREIRGVIYGTATASGYLGQLVLCVFGGWLFDNIGAKSPFIFVGTLDVFTALITIVLGCCGVIKNDIKIR